MGPAKAARTGHVPIWPRRCSDPTWANRTGLIWLSILSRNQKLKHANKLTFLIISKKEHFAPHKTRAFSQCETIAAPAAKSVRVPYRQPLQGLHGPCIALLAE